MATECRAEGDPSGLRFAGGWYHRGFRSTVRGRKITSNNPEDARLSLCLVSIHGLIRGFDLELGRDADTGGQTQYVVDLARALARHPGVECVDLITRRVVDPAVSDDYARREESLGDGARIVRIDCGPPGYIPKEELWDHLDAFADNLIDWLGSQPERPSVIHSHYADAGYVGVRVANLLGLPLVHTGHSLGRDKRKRLLARGLTRDAIERAYNISRRIDAEEEILANAGLVITSTNNEIEQQYGLYNYYEPGRMAVIPPGTDLDRFGPDGEHTDTAFGADIARFLTDPDKPLILALSRPDERKNIITLIEAFGENPELRERANLLIVAGNREDIRDLDDGAQGVLTSILISIDSQDLYGKVAVPKKHSPDQVPEIYRLAARTGGVFINPALTEPFGLTLLEAAASGLPIVATENGGPVDIIANCACGVLVDPLDKAQIAMALLGLLRNRRSWQRYASNGIEQVPLHYAWSNHAARYVETVRGLVENYTPLEPVRPLPRALRYRDRMIVTDLDQNLLGDDDALTGFVDTVRRRRKSVSFAIATGRRIDSALALIKKHGIPQPDVLISSLGTDIRYDQSLNPDAFWADHIDHQWSGRRIRHVLSEVPGLQLQDRQQQTPFKISYFYDEEEAGSLEEIVSLLHQSEVTANVTLSFGQFLDIVPARASKGLALRYVASRLEIPLEQILVAGGSGADEDMMRGNTLAVVVSNRHNEELSTLAEVDRIFFATRGHAEGILEAIDHYDFFGSFGAAGGNSVDH